MTYKTQAIILRSFDVKEHDRMYTIFSKEHGIMPVLGIGTRKAKAKLAPGLEPLTKSELFCIKGRQFDRVAGVIIDQQFPALKRELDGLDMSKKLIQILQMILPDKEQAPGVYASFDFFLQGLNKQCAKQEGCGGSPAALLRLCSIWKALYFSGYEPHVFHCTSCATKILSEKEHFFQIPGGMVCVSCLGKEKKSGLEISQDAIKVLRLFLYKGHEVISKVRVSSAVLKELEKTTIIYLEHILNKKIYL